MKQTENNILNLPSTENNHKIVADYFMDKNNTNPGKIWSVLSYLFGEFTYITSYRLKHAAKIFPFIKECTDYNHAVKQLKNIDEESFEKMKEGVLKELGDTTSKELFLRSLRDAYYKLEIEVNKRLDIVEPENLEGKINNN